MQSVNNEGKDLFCLTALYWCALELVRKDGRFRCVSKCSKYDSSCQSGICHQSEQISVLLLMFSLILKNPPVLSGRGEKLDVLLENLSKGVYRQSQLAAF